MKNYLIALVFALVSGFVGMFLPFVTSGATNIPLGFLYGFGWYVAGFVKSVRAPNVQTFGAFVWPLVVMVAIVYLLGKALARHPERRRAVIIGCAVPFLLIVPDELLQRTRLSKYIPLYSTTLASVY